MRVRFLALLGVSTTLFGLSCGKAEETFENSPEANKPIKLRPTAPPTPPPGPEATENTPHPPPPGSFTVLAYNVENLFDVDGVSVYDDYEPDHYGPSQLKRKLEVITKVLAAAGEDGSGPDIVLLQEIEADRTPDRDASASELLAAKLKEKNLGPYHIVEGRIAGQTQAAIPSVVCVTLSKFPVEEVRLHPLERARPILETRISVDGRPLVLFNNHWKSGASSSAMEKVRVENARVLRKRLNDLLTQNPTADLIVGGDLNSHYNQKTLFGAAMPQTAVNDVLLAQEEAEAAMLHPTRKLHNLWHELPPRHRGSEVWKGNWGTLMHLLLSHGLYDDQGLSYFPDSFRVLSLPGLNASLDSGVPLKWSNELGGRGASDHLPILATFTRSRPGVRPKVSSSPPVFPTEEFPVDYSKALANAPVITRTLLNPENYGRVFRFTGRVAKAAPLELVTPGGHVRIWTFDAGVRSRLFTAANGETPISGHGHLSRYRGEWQLIVEKPDWLK